jgi:hypothetical protein
LYELEVSVAVADLFFVPPLPLRLVVSFQSAAVESASDIASQAVVNLETLRWSSAISEDAALLLI